MARKQTAKLPGPADSSQDIPEDEFDDDDDPTSTGGKVVSKASAVRDAIARGKVTPEDGTSYIKRVYGLDITKQMFSSYKSQEKLRRAKAGSKGKPGRKPRAGAGQSAPGDSASSSNSAKGDANLLDAMEAMKPLVANLGAERVKRIVDLLG
jgi:hypothetical protein